MLLPFRSRAARLREFTLLAAASSLRPPDRDRALVFGPDPIRVTVLGNGIGVGFGVEFRAHALDGVLAERLAAGTGRGVVVTNWARPGSQLTDQMASARMSRGFELEDVVVWCPSHLQTTGFAWGRQWGRQLAQLVSAVPPRGLMVALLLPEPLGREPIVRLAAARTARINAAVTAVAVHHERVLAVAAPPLTVPAAGRPLFDRGYYAETGAVLAAAVLPRLVGQPVWRPSSVSVRSVTG